MTNDPLLGWLFVMLAAWMVCGLLLALDSIRREWMYRREWRRRMHR
jgi:hypothetical protein